MYDRIYSIFYRVGLYIPIDWKGDCKMTWYKYYFSDGWKVESGKLSAREIKAEEAKHGKLVFMTKA